MEELELWKEFREAKVPYVSNRSKKEFYRVFGKISKEQFVSLDLQNGWGDFDSKSGIRKFLFLQKYLRGEEKEWHEPKIAAPEDEIFEKLKKQKDINRELKEKYERKIEGLKHENQELSEKLLKANDSLAKVQNVLLLCEELHNVYADCLIEGENEK